MFPELDKKALRNKKMNTNNQPVYFKARIFMENYYIFSQLLIQAKLLGHFIEVKNTYWLWVSYEDDWNRLPVLSSFTRL